MSDIHSFPKIFTVGSDYIPDLFRGEVEITEKMDGSQFGFGHSEEGKVVLRSKGQQLYPEAGVPSMFEKGVEFVLDNQVKILERLPKNSFFYGEYFAKPKQNILAYDRTPKHNIMIFGMTLGGSYIKDYAQIKEWAEKFDLETVPLLFRGPISSLDELQQFMDTDSVLGGQKLEGIVIKNYVAKTLIGNLVMPSFGKLVRADFKERHSREWKHTFGKKARIDTFMDSFRTEARWQKAIQHLQEQGRLKHEPADIGILMKEINIDLISEERKNIEKELYEIHIDDIRRKACAGFPEWYKDQLVKRTFIGDGAVAV